MWREERSRRAEMVVLVERVWEPELERVCGPGTVPTQLERMLCGFPTVTSLLSPPKAIYHTVKVEKWRGKPAHNHRSPSIFRSWCREEGDQNRWEGTVQPSLIHGTFQVQMRIFPLAQHERFVFSARNGQARPS